MIAIIDNYDSFTYNLVQYLGELGAELCVYRNDAVTLEELEALAPSHIVISPGPGRPEDGGISNDVIRHFHRKVPILGVCLGHQCIGHVFGGQVSRGPRLMHGKTSPIHHTGRGLFASLPNPFVATRYHSLVVERASLPEGLVETAWTLDAEDGAAGDRRGELMGLRHRTLPLEGVQFHPESILSESGHDLLCNWLRALASE